MTLTEMRSEARKSLAGKWGKAAILMLVYALITSVISFVLGLIPFVGSIIQLVINLPITYGFLVCMIKLKRGEEVSYTEFLNNGFGSFKKVWIVLGNTILKLIVPICLVVVFTILLYVGGFGAVAGTAANSNGAATGFGALGIIGLIGSIVAYIWVTIKGLLYALSQYILYDNPDMSGKEIVEESERLMKGNRVRYFFLPFTFIGWIILAGFTFGIGALWLTPYMMVTTVVFYESLAGNKGTTEKVVEAKVEEPKSEEETPAE